VYSTPDRNKGREAITSFELVYAGTAYSLLRLRPVTGRKNQLRVHLRDYGHPVAGDKKYGARTNPLGRLCLHAAVLSFMHPVTKKRIELVSRAPKDFSRIKR
jgi:23S rRNA pseudouridine1911/1915/1917 synthase